MSRLNAFPILITALTLSACPDQDSLFAKTRDTLVRTLSEVPQDGRLPCDTLKERLLDHGTDSLDTGGAWIVKEQESGADPALLGLPRDVVLRGTEKHPKPGTAPAEVDVTLKFFVVKGRDGLTTGDDAVDAVLDLADGQFPTGGGVEVKIDDETTTFLGNRYLAGAPCTPSQEKALK